MKRKIVVNGLPLPDQLVDLIDRGQWVAPDEGKIWTVFGEKPSQAIFYTLEDMEFENERWGGETLPEYLGQADADFPPGDIDPKCSVLIGDLGHDLPFALDYRDSVAEPRVVFLGTRVEERWITVANNLANLFSDLGLT
jgi:hypothetical protein